MITFTCINDRGDLLSISSEGGDFKVSLDNTMQHVCKRYIPRTEGKELAMAILNEVKSKSLAWDILEGFS